MHLSQHTLMMSFFFNVIVFVTDKIVLHLLRTSSISINIYMIGTVEVHKTSNPHSLPHSAGRSS